MKAANISRKDENIESGVLMEHELNDCHERAAQDSTVRAALA
jgi:hypothetical protein